MIREQPIPPVDWHCLPDLPDKIGVAGAFAGVSDGCLLVAGGANFLDKMPWDGGTKTWHDTVYILDKPDGSWREVGALPRPLGYGVSVTTSSGVVCVGGSDFLRHYGEAFRLSWTDGKLTTTILPPLPTAIANHCGAFVAGTLYVVGGSEKPGELECVNRAFALDGDDKDAAWREIQPLPGSPRFLSAAAAHNGSLFVMGGASLDSCPDGKMRRSYLKEIWSYRPDNGWTPHAPMPKPAVAAPTPAPVIDGHLLVLGGDDGSLAGFQPLAKHPGFTKSIQSYDIETNAWSQRDELPAGHAVLPCVLWQGLIVLVSGEQRPGVRTPCILARSQAGRMESDSFSILEAKIGPS
jgi:N-acetylneuraminate epimerase